MKKIFVWVVVLLSILALVLAAPELTINDPSSGRLNTTNITFNITLNETGTAWYYLNYNGVDGANITMNSTDNLTFTTINDTLLDGNYTAFFFGNDSSNSTNDSESVSFVIDTIAANLTVISPTVNQSFETSSSVFFNVTTDENLSSVVGWLNGVASFPLSTTDNVSWTYTNSSVPNADYNVSFVSTDMAGNINETTNVSFTVDFTVPGVTINSPAAGVGTSSSIIFNITADETIDTAYVNISGTLYTMSSTDNLTFNYTNSSMPDGSYTVFFWVNDTSGNINDSESVSFGIDTTAPTISSTFPSNNSNVSPFGLNFTITLNETSTAWYNLNNGSNISMTSTDNLTFWDVNATLTDATYIARFYANDTRNNTVSTQITFTVNATLFAPAISITNPANGSTVNQSDINFTASINTTGTIWFNLNDVENITMNTSDNLSFSYYNASVADGDYNATFYANDSNNNVRVSIISFTVNTTVPDTSVPGVTINSPAASSFASSSVIFNITANETVDTAFLNISGTLYQMSSVDNLTFNYTNASMPDGSYTAFFWVNDSSNNINDTQSVAFTIDTTAPGITVNTPANESNLTSASVTFNITLNESGMAWFNLNGVENITMNTTDNLTFTYVNSSIPDGNYQATFYANDSLNNLRSSSINFSINTSDTTVPGVTINSPSAGASNSASVNFNITANETIDTAFVNISGTLYTMSSTDNLTFNYTNSSISDGTYTVFFWVNDTSNNINDTQSVSFTIDTVAPNYTVVAPVANTTFNTSSVFFNVTTTENLTSVVGTLNGSATFSLSTTDNVSWTYTNASVPNGEYNVSFLLTDVAGNTNETTNTSFSVSVPTPDTTAPGINVTNPTNGSTVNASSINFTVVLNESGSVWFNLNNGSNITMSTSDNLTFYYLNSSIADATYYAYFFANDTSGNNASLNTTFTVDTFVPDTTIPNVTINSPAATGFNTSSVTFNITASETIDTAFLNLSGTLYPMSSTDNLTFNYTNSSMTDGNYTAYFWVNDTQNNINDTQSVSFSVDTTPPVLGLTFPANGSYVASSQSFTYNVTDTNTYNITQVLNGSSTVLTSTTFTPFSAITTSGTYVLSVVGTDSLGNTNTTESFTYFVDVDAPTVNVTVANTTVPSNITFSIFDGLSNLSSVWYNVNGIENRTINASVNASSLAGELIDQFFAGSHTINVYANDSVGNTANQSAEFVVNGEINLSDEQATIVTNANNATSSFRLSNGSVISNDTPVFNNTDLDNLSFEITVNQTVPITINFTGLNGSLVRWNASFDNITDNVTSITSALLENFSLDNFTLLSLEGQERVFPNGSYDVISVLFQIDPADFTVLYYFDEDISFDEKTDVNQCAGGSYTDGDTLPCWVNSSGQTQVYLPGFSSVVVGTDTIAPNITVVQPTATVTTSSFTPTITVSSDVDTCIAYYNNTATNSTGTFNGTACTFATIYVTDGLNGSLNFTVNDTSGNINTTTVEFNFSDSTAPSVNITAPSNGSTVTSSSVTLTVSSSELVNVTRSYDGGSFSSCFTNATSGSCSVSGLSDGSRNITINATDLSGNSVLETVYFTVDIPSSGSSGGGSSSSSSSDDDDDDDDDDDRPRRTNSFPSFNDDDTTQDQEQRSPFSYNGTPQDFQTSVDAEEEFTLRVNDTITVSTDNGDLTFKMISFDDNQKTVVLEVNGETVTANMAGAVLYDSNGDGEQDLMITLSNLAAGLAQVTISRPSQVAIVDEDTDEDDDNPIGTLPWLPISIVAGVVLLILGIIMFLKHHERKHQALQSASPKAHGSYTPKNGPDAASFSANKFMKEEKSETKSFSANNYLHKN